MSDVSCEPLGDQAVLARCRDEQSAAALAAGVRSANPAWLVDLVPAYTTVALFFDHRLAGCQQVMDWLKSVTSAGPVTSGRDIVIPCDYSVGPDLDRVAAATGLAADEVIRLHCSVTYTVFAIGFCPGFPYLGYLPEPLCGVPRLPSPRLRVEPGSVGITGRQTGIYPLVRPGGWNLLGRTPTQLVDLSSGFFLLRPGDLVRFQPVDAVAKTRKGGQTPPKKPRMRKT